MESKSVRKTVRTTIYLPEDLHDELRMEAIRQRISMTQLVMRAIQRDLQYKSKETK